MIKQIFVTVDRFEGDYAILKHKGDEILLPIEDLPEDTKESSVLTLSIMNEIQATKNKTELAKEILNDILNDSMSVPELPPHTHEQHDTKEEEELHQINKKLDELNNNFKNK